MKLLVTYDIANDRLRSKFSKYLSKFGRRLQYSVFEVKNSERILKLICFEITTNYSKKFDQSDSVIIFKMSSSCEQINFGYAKNDESDLIIL
jgi:CRISPR-associated protein Cas2